ncbi:MAG: uroporphyrinogen-III synthase [Acidobacteriota bacterium]
MTDVNQPLKGRTVLVTRAIEQAQETVSLLESLGARVLCVPMIKIVPPDSWQAVDRAIDQLASYHYLIFTSANGVKFFFERLNDYLHKDLSKLTAAKICAIGEATARTLKNFAINANLIATDARAEGLLSAIIENAGGEENIAGLRFLLPRAQAARDLLPLELGKLGATVDDLTVYQTVSTTANREALVEQLAQGKIDVVMFTSPSTIHHFVALIGQENLSGLMQTVWAACIGSVTAATAREYHLQNLIQPPVYSAAALIESIVAAFTK